jgi:hypothetical protein
MTSLAEQGHEGNLSLLACGGLLAAVRAISLVMGLGVTEQVNGVGAARTL